MEIGQIIDFRTVRSMYPVMIPAKKCCLRCGADVWHIRENGDICCADCDEVCPLQLQVKNEY